MHSALLARLAGRPLALAPRALDGLLGLAPEALGALPPFRGEDRATAGYALTENGIAVVPIHGPLLTRGDWLSALMGATSYDEVAATIAGAFVDPGVRAVLLELDSPGGEVGGLFDLVDAIAALRAEAGKPLWAVAGEGALSAAYAIASAAERLYVTRTGEVGSIGVVAAHLDASGADAIAGRKWTLVHAGARKVDGNGHEPLSPRAFAAIQADVDALHAELVETVARNRGTTPTAIRATEAAIYRGERGRAAGLADRVGTRDRALADLALSLDPPPGRPARLLTTRPAQGTSMTEPTITATAEPPAVTDAQTATAPATPPETPPAQPAAAAPAVGVAPAPAPARLAPAAQPAVGAAPAPDAPGASVASADAARLRAEFAEIAAVAAQAGRLGVAIDAADAMARGVAPDALRRSVLETLAARSEAAAVVPATPAPSAAAGESPIVRRARERAAASA